MLQTVDLNQWKTFYSTLPRGVDSFSVEIFDEKSFTTDERIAWAVLNIPERVIQGETVDDWYPLSGKQGDLAEGQGKVHHIVRTSGLLFVNFRSNDEPQKLIWSFRIKNINNRCIQATNNS